MRTDTGTTVHLSDYAPTLFDARHVTLMISLHPKATVVRNSTDYAPRGSVDDPLVLEGDGLNLVAADLNGAPLPAHAYEATPDRFVLKNPPKKSFELTLTTIVAPDDNTELMGLYRSSGIYCTQCEAEGFRRITYAYDRPDVLSTYDVWMLADGPGEQVLLSNGNLVAEGEQDGRAYAQWHDPFPKPTYLFALVAGKLGAVRDTFVTASGRRVALAIYVEPGKESRAGYAMDALKRSMTWDEERFGREYDLDVFNIVAVSDFNMGAMENKGLNVFNDRYVLADPAVATDADYAGIEAVIAHEYFHNWTGNRITCRDWFQLCLKEGLTVFRDQEFTADVRSRGVKRVQDAKRLRLAQFREDASPLRHPVRPSKYDEISNLYTATVYEKGAELVRMIHTLIGETAFRKSMDTYFDRYDGTAATVEDFLGCFAPLDTKAFMAWYEEAGTPTVSVEEEFADGTATITLTQIPAADATRRPVPIRIAAFGDTGPLDLGTAKVSGADLDGDLLVLTGDRATVTLSGQNAAPVVSVLRAFSAPVTLERRNDPERDIALLTRETDPFSIWDAAQRLLIGALLSAYAGETPDLTATGEALSAVVTDDAHEAALRALLLEVPSRFTVIEALGEDVDADKVDAAFRSVSTALGEAMQPALAALHDAPAPAADDVSATAAGARALRNTALTLLAAAGDTGRAATQAEAAGNMTDKLAALGALAAANAPETDSALQTFHDAFSHEALVLDKYFALQALRGDGDPKARVEGLMQHPAFSLSNPNRTRSLIGAFSQNIAAFHAADGSGYRFLADTASKLDRQNPQVAARLLTAFGDVRRFDATRRSAAKQALEGTFATVKSSDVADIVRRLLSAA